MGPIGWPETSGRNCHCTLRNISEKGRSHLLCGGSLKSSRVYVTLRARCTILSFNWLSQLHQYWDPLLTKIYISLQWYGICYSPQKFSAPSFTALFVGRATYFHQKSKRIMSSRNRLNASKNIDAFLFNLMYYVAINIRHTNLLPRISLVSVQ